MNKYKYLIIGGGVAGTTSADFIRLDDPQGSIAIIGEEAEVLYSRVLLPQYLRNQVSYDRLFLRKQSDYEEKKIELLKGVRVTKIDTKNKKITLNGGEILDYERLLAASGGKVNKLDIPGKELKGVNYLRTTTDAKQIKEQMKEAKNAVVIGAGFIGAEFAQSFVQNGLKTTCIIREPYFWENVVGENSGKLIGQILEKNDVEIIAQTYASGFLGQDKLSSVKLDSGQEIPADIAGVGVGIHMDLDYLKDSGIKINRGAVANQYLETETQDVWAAGDIAEFYDVVADKYHQMGNWSNAGAQGRVVGSNMAKGWKKENLEEFVTVSAYTIAIFGNSFTFMGDPSTDENTDSIERGSIADGKLGRISLKNDTIVAASLINLSSDRTAITELIKNKIKITAARNKISDLSFDLNNLLD